MKEKKLNFNFWFLPIYFFNHCKKLFSQRCKDVFYNNTGSKNISDFNLTIISIFPIQILKIKSKDFRIYVSGLVFQHFIFFLQSQFEPRMF